MKSSLLELHTEPFTIEREWERDGIPVLSASVSIPHPASSKSGVCRRICRFYDLQARSFLRYCERWLLPEAAAQCQAALAASAPLPRLQAGLHYHITYNEGGFWSLYTQSCEPAPTGGRSLFFRHGDTWDLSTGYPAAVGSFFPPHFRWKSRFLTLAAQEIQAQDPSPPLQSQKLLSHAGGHRFLFPHVLHCPSGRTDPRFPAALQRDPPVRSSRM